jgi:hypothetical protein
VIRRKLKTQAEFPGLRRQGRGTLAAFAAQSHLCPTIVAISARRKVPGLRKCGRGLNLISTTTTAAVTAVFRRSRRGNLTG